MKNHNRLIVILMAALATSAVSARADALVATDSNLNVMLANPPKLQAFSLKDIRLLDGPFRDAMELDRRAE
jgi:hypothetical protein